MIKFSVCVCSNSCCVEMHALSEKTIRFFRGDAVYDESGNDFTIKIEKSGFNVSTEVIENDCGLIEIDDSALFDDSAGESINLQRILGAMSRAGWRIKKAYFVANNGDEIDIQKQPPIWPFTIIDWDILDALLRLNNTEPI